MKEENLYTKPTKKQLLKFIIPSAIGIFLFLFPIPWKDSVNIPLGVISDFFAALIKPAASLGLMIVITISALFSLITYLFKPKFIMDNKLLSKLFVTSPAYIITRILGSIVTIMCYFQVGPEVIISPDTGGTMMGLLETLVAWFFAASFLMPFLMDYGLLELVGTILRDFTRPLFKIPGRATIDLLASWVGNCNVGVVLTSQQYEKGYYTAREAITIATCFSAVSLPFCLVIAAMLGVDDKFIPFYAILCITGVLSVVIMTRIPPLNRYPDEYYPLVGKQIQEEEPEGIKKTQWGLKLAVEKAEKGLNIKQILYNGVETWLGIVFSLTPIVMSFGTLALVLATYTPAFDWLSLPFGYYLKLLGLEEAFKAAPATIVGFADMFIPAILAANIASYKTRFVIGILSLVQIIYMTEVGTLIMTSKMPIGFKGLLAIFIEKTIISLPIIVLLTNLFGITG
ncbi:YjiH family protein [Tepidimicrobium xylanilyticum]|uniref:Nucleoside recognition GATE domain-containing membrane protein YjiH n=1 Tax=Tepidimicrobium xylanilyticum TaxID=1123352 RepID=A0A1H2RN04_9FIRM|nr:YjiH family protein [Tepidimicrobium xylanilyticum]SDW20811.1 nucleoside recognition GATE domain-containing membrane protein YjiH [Tepidimicrobium xylanilyticum]